MTVKDRSSQAQKLKGRRNNAKEAALRRLQALHPAQYGELLAEERRLDPGPEGREPAQVQARRRAFWRARAQTRLRLKGLYFLQYHRLLKEEHLKLGLAAPRKPRQKMTLRQAQQVLDGLVGLGAARADREERGTVYLSPQLLEACALAVQVLSEVAAAGDHGVAAVRQGRQQTA